MAESIKKSDDEIKSNYGTSHYLNELNQLNKLYTEPVGSESRSIEEMGEEERLALYAKLLRILLETGSIPLNYFQKLAQAEAGLDPASFMHALTPMLEANLVFIDEGKVNLTPSGKEMLAA